MALPKEGIPRPKLPSNFPLFLLITAAQSISFPRQVKAKVTLQDGGDGGAIGQDGGDGGDAGISWITFEPGVQYLALIGSGGAPGGAGGFTSLTKKNGVARTTANSQISLQGGTAQKGQGGNIAGSGGGSLLGTESAFTSTTGHPNQKENGHLYGGGGSGSGGSDPTPGTAGGPGCILLEFING